MWYILAAQLQLKFCSVRMRDFGTTYFRVESLKLHYCIALALEPFAVGILLLVWFGLVWFQGKLNRAPDPHGCNKSDRTWTTTTTSSAQPFLRKWHDAEQTPNCIICFWQLSFFCSIMSGGNGSWNSLNNAIELIVHNSSFVFAVWFVVE